MTSSTTTNTESTTVVHDITIVIPYVYRKTIRPHDCREPFATTMSSDDDSNQQTSTCTNIRTMSISLGQLLENVLLI
jgi:hypothetical protein